jgi:hypothetical protein
MNDLHIFNSQIRVFSVVLQPKLGLDHITLRFLRHTLLGKNTHTHTHKITHTHTQNNTHTHTHIHKNTKYKFMVYVRILLANTKVH